MMAATRKNLFLNSNALQCMKNVEKFKFNLNNQQI